MAGLDQALEAIEQALDVSEVQAGSPYWMRTRPIQPGCPMLDLSSKAAWAAVMIRQPLDIQLALHWFIF